LDNKIVKKSSLILDIRPLVGAQQMLAAVQPPYNIPATYYGFGGMAAVNQCWPNVAVDWIGQQSLSTGLSSSNDLHDQPQHSQHYDNEASTKLTDKMMECKQLLLLKSDDGEQATSKSKMEPQLNINSRNEPCGSRTISNNESTDFQSPNTNIPEYGEFTLFLDPLGFIKQIHWLCLVERGSCLVERGKETR